MSPVAPEDFEDLKRSIAGMKRGGTKADAKPHKLVMLLAVIDLFERGIVSENRVYFDERLIKAFEYVFGLVCSPDDWQQPGPPYFHLRSSGFWQHQPKPGRESEYRNLTTSGGGTARILENIDFAYLSEEAFAVLSDTTLRSELRGFIVSLINPISAVRKAGPTAIAQTLKWGMGNNRIGTVFHESFPLSRTSVAEVIKALSEGSVTPEHAKLGVHERLRATTNLGTNYVKAMPRYALGAGLMDSSYALTDFGESVHKCDPMLEHWGTQWLMHYHLAAPSGPGPEFWHSLVIKQFLSGEVLEIGSVATQIGHLHFEGTGKQLASKSQKSTAGAFLRSYTRSEALGNLGILSQESPDRYLVQEPEPPPVWAVAYALLDFWDARFGDQVSAGLNELYGEKGLTSLFMISRGRLNTMLEAMQAEGMLELHLIAAPYQVMLLKRDRAWVLGKLYGTDRAE